MSNATISISPRDILAIREAFGWTQAQLAEQVGLTYQAISMWERGERSPSGSAAILLDSLRQRAEKKTSRKTR